MNRLSDWGKVTAVSYSESQGIAIVHVKGHPTTALDRAYHLLQAIFVNHPKWRITYAVYSPPNSTQLASEGEMRVQGEVINESC